MTDQDARIAALNVATRANITDEEAAVYARGLEHLAGPLVAEACARLALTEQWFPTLARIIEECTAVTDEEARERDGERYREEMEAWAPISKPRAKLKALRAGEPPPRPPVVLESTEQMFRCGLCRDVGWIERTCEGGSRRSCGRSDKGGFMPNPSPNASGLAAHVYVGSCRVPHDYVERCVCRLSASSDRTA